MMVIEESRIRRDGNEGQTTWLNVVPKKVCIFVWRARLGRLSVRSELDKRGIDLDSIICPRCESEEETIDHALVKCNKVETLWSQVGRWWKIDVDRCCSIEELVNKGNQQGRNALR